MAYKGAGRVHFHQAETFDVTLIGINDQVDQNEFGASQSIDVDGGERDEVIITGEIIGVLWKSRTTGTGTVIKAPFDLVFFDADPSVTAGDTNLTVTASSGLIAAISITTGDYVGTLTSIAFGSKAFALPIRTDASGDLWVAPINRSATSYNDAGGDDEVLEATIVIRRDN